MSERILCAAIWVDTGKAEPPRRSYSYPKTGLVFGAYRHGDCFTAVHAWYAQLSWLGRWRLLKRQSDMISWWRFWRKPWYHAWLGIAGRHQGFITSQGRFVDRDEGFEIAKVAGQLIRDRRGEGCLTSEDLY